MKKKILFIYPTSYNSQGHIIKSKKSFIPSRTLPYLAALTPTQYDVSIIDELIDDINFNEKFDLVALTGMLRNMPRAIDIAREFQKRNIPTIIGGVGAFSIQEDIEKSNAFSSIVIGEVDELWEVILRDFEQGKLKKLYKSSGLPELKALPAARFDLLNQKKYLKSFIDLKSDVLPIETSRGCPHNCRFCLVTRYFGRRMRYRPIEEVIEEIKFHKGKHILFTDDNIAINPTRAKELFLALKPLKIKWFGQFDSNIAHHPDVLKLASESGCAHAFVGIESLVCDNLHKFDKSYRAKTDFKDIVAAFKKADIVLFTSLIFGMDHDTPELIDWTMEQMLINDVEIVAPWLLTPFPRTPLYDDFKKGGRLIHENYSLYDACHVVIQPKHMTIDELDKAFWKGLKRFYSWKFILRRTSLHKKDKITAFIYNFYARRQVSRNKHPFTGNI